MIPIWLIILICIFYLAFLFWIAFYGDKKTLKKSIINSPIVYALSLTTYCTAWTFYGSVGKASAEGISFLATYLGPIILCPLWILIFKKIIRICKKEKISSISDFIATRYGKDKFLGNLITVMILLFIVPYISIQLRAIATTFNILIKNESTINNETALIVAAIMSVFIILFGRRNNSANERNEGMVAAIAFESIFKLVAFITTAIYIIFFIFNGFQDIFTQAIQQNMLGAINDIKQSLDGGYWDWFMLILLSLLTFILLPRQFHLIALENKNEEHVNTASWVFPLYLFAITLFVIPIAIAGKLYFKGTNFSPDTYILQFPMQNGNNLLATLVFLGGFAAATGMIIVETIAVSTMLSNNIIIPIVISRLKSFKTSKVRQVILFCKQVSIPIVLFSAYLYMIIIGDDYPLVEIGLISFVGIVQLAPSFFGGLIWKRANKTGTILGIIGGFIVWFYTLLFPTFIKSGIIDGISLITEGPFGMYLLKPYSLLGLEGLNEISHGFFWSILINVLLYVLGSLFTLPKGIEIQQANKFIDPLRDPNENRFRNKYKQVYFYQIYELIIRFVGSEIAEEHIDLYYKKHFIKYKNNEVVNIHFVDYMEDILSSYIGNISARITISKLLNEEPLNRKELIKILEETKEAITHSKILKAKSNELKKAKKALLKSNEKLKKTDQIKDEFILTISHELRTPVTSIRLLAEMLHNEPDVYENKKEIFLKTIVQESERLSSLIDDTLLHEKLELGQLKWNFNSHSINQIVTEAFQTISPIAKKENIAVTHKPLEFDIFINADVTHLSRVFINILVNAIKFNDPLKVDKIIDITLKLEDKYIVTIIEDNGIGVLKEHQKKIFKTFIQIHDERLKIKPKGSGLGLSIAKKIVEQHKGLIKIESNLNRYTRFLIYLPINN